MQTLRDQFEKNLTTFCKIYECDYAETGVQLLRFVKSADTVSVREVIVFFKGGRSYVFCRDFAILAGLYKQFLDCSLEKIQGLEIAA